MALPCSKPWSSGATASSPSELAGDAGRVPASRDRSGASQESEFWTMSSERNDPPLGAKPAGTPLEPTSATSSASASAAAGRPDAAKNDSPKSDAPKSDAAKAAAAKAGESPSKSSVPSSPAKPAGAAPAAGSSAATAAAPRRGLGLAGVAIVALVVSIVVALALIATAPRWTPLVPGLAQPADARAISRRRSRIPALQNSRRGSSSLRRGHRPLRPANPSAPMSPACARNWRDWPAPRRRRPMRWRRSRAAAPLQARASIRTPSSGAWRSWNRNSPEHRRRWSVRAACAARWTR